MMEFKNILFPIDLAEVSQKLIDHVCTFARKFGAKVHLLYVVRTFEPYPSADYVPGPHAEAGPGGAAGQYANPARRGG